MTASTLFTTHTPVPAGIDTFPASLAEKYLRPYAAALGLPVERFLALGQTGAYSPERPFSMAILALTTIIKLTLWPIQNKANRSMRQMAALSPKSGSVDRSH